MFKRRKIFVSVKLLIITYTHLVGYMKSSASESKPIQNRFKVEIPGRARREERLSHSKLKKAFLVDSDAKPLMYLIQCIKFGTWKVRCLNRALVL